MVAFGLLCTKFAIGQDHQLMINGTWTPSTTNFLQSYPFPASTSTATQHLVGNGYDAIATRGIFYGGNLGVSQDISNYGNAGGKWSFIGGWKRYLGSGYSCSPPCSFSPGLNYLVNYHRWGDYSAHFGLVSASTSTNDGGVFIDAELKNTVISWSYEHNKTANRLIFQSIIGVDASGSSGMVMNEWATILSNGNIGSGTSAPLAQFEMKPLSSNYSPHMMEMYDYAGMSKIRFTKTGELLLGPFSGGATATATTVLDVKGNVRIAQFTTTAGNIALDVSGNTSFIGDMDVTGKIRLNRIPGATPAADFGMEGSAYIKGSLFLDGNVANPFSINSNTVVSLGKNILSLGGKGELTIRATTLGSSASPVALLDIKRWDSPTATSIAITDLFSINDVGTAFLPQYSAGYLKVDATGMLFSSTTPFTTNSIWETAGNDFSSTSTTNIIGSIESTGTPPAPYNHQIDFYVGHRKAFEIINSTTNGKHGFTNFIRNVSIWGGTSATGHDNGGTSASSYNSEDWSLTVHSSLNPPNYIDPINNNLYTTDYLTKGIFRCLDGNAQPLILVGAKEIGFGNNCNGYSSIPTTTLKFGNCAATGTTYDDFDLMRSTTSNSNQMDIWGKLDIHEDTRVYGNISPNSTNTYDIGASGSAFSNIYGRNIYASNLIKGESFMPETPATLATPTVPATGSDIGDLNNHFNEIWGDDIHAENLIPLNGSTPAPSYYMGTSSVGTSSLMWYQVWSETGVVGSDRRLKENIEPLKYGLKTILSLKPYTYKLKSHKDGFHHGFIAQELKEIFPNSIVQGKESDSSYYGVTYDEFVPILTLALQEQQAIIEAQKSSIDSLKRKLNFVFAINQIKDIKNVNNQKESINQLPLLFQNHPNPFNGFTFIDYYIPDNITDAFLRVIDNNGKLVKAFSINKTGFGQIELDCSNLASGQYHYSLLVNSQLIDTKSMIIAIAN